MSMFPYGYKFEKDRLILKWIDEGFFVLADNVIKLEAERLFSELVDSNVITCVASNCKHKQDEAEACQWQINHFMHQFLASKSAEMGFVFTTTTLNLLAESAAATTTECGNQTSSRMPRRLALHHPDPLLPSMLETMDLSQTTVLGFDRIGPKFGGIHPFRTGPRKNGTGQNISAQFEFSAQPMVSSSLHKPSIDIKAQTQK